MWISTTFSLLQRGWRAIGSMPFPWAIPGVGAIVCDVMGHGIRAALIASMLRGLMEQLSHLADNPAAFLSSLNHQLAKILQRRIPRCSPPPFIFTWIWKPAS